MTGEAKVETRESRLERRGRRRRRERGVGERYPAAGNKVMGAELPRA
jgi:hypothetical protein